MAGLCNKPHKLMTQIGEILSLYNSVKQVTLEREITPRHSLTYGLLHANAAHDWLIATTSLKAGMPFLCC